MSARYLLDTNIISDLIRNPDGAAANRATTTDARLLGTSIIVAAELRFGVEKRGASVFAHKLETILEVLEVHAFDRPADAAYARLRADLERANLEPGGLPIGGNDLLIAAHALALGCTMVTANVREFARVPGLTVENWLV